MARKTSTSRFHLMTLDRRDVPAFVLIRPFETDLAFQTLRADLLHSSDADSAALARAMAIPTAQVAAVDNAGIAVATSLAYTSAAARGIPVQVTTYAYDDLGVRNLPAT